MNADLDEVKQIKPWHYLVSIAASGLIPLTFTRTIETETQIREFSHSYYLGFFAVLFWVMKTFDLNPGRALARGKWVLLVGLLACVARNAMSL